jgi:outer membrane protein OmpA-like peptidoglycan-associated protein
MNIKLKISTLAVLIAANAFGQSEGEKPRRHEVSMQFGLNMVELVNGLGESEPGAFTTDMGETPMSVGFGYNYQFSPAVGIKFDASYDMVSGINTIESYQTTGIGGFLGLSMRPLAFTQSDLNGVYVDAQVGYLNYTAERHFVSDGSMMVPPFTENALAVRSKLGYKVALNEQLKLDLGLRYLSVMSDAFDGWDFDGANADAVMTPSIGLTYVLGPKNAKDVASDNVKDNLLESLGDVATAESVEKLGKQVNKNTGDISDVKKSSEGFVKSSDLDELMLTVLENNEQFAGITKRGELKGVLTIYFEFDSDKIDQKYRKELSDFLKGFDMDDSRILLVGYADIYGTQEYNENLKSERVDAVKRALMNSYNVPAESITSQIGEIKVSNVAQQYLNRRVDIFIY